MQFRIDNASNRPVYQQIIDQIKRDIALGRLLNPRFSTTKQGFVFAGLATGEETLALAAGHGGFG